jgi:nicotinamidase-related amidase
LLLIDVVNDFDFVDGEQLLRAARPMARALAKLKARAERRGVPVVYVNDNFGRWRSDFKAIVRHCTRPSAPGREVVEQLLPTSLDYFVLKPANSGFYATALEALLRDLGPETLILTGLATDNCVLFTAHDAYLRGFKLIVPTDCVAANTRALHQRSLSVMQRTMKADVRASAGVRLPRARAGKR